MSDQRDVKDEDDPYLWDRSGPADPTVQKLEALLAPLAMKDLAVPMPVVVRPARTRPATIAIAGFALAAVALIGFFAGRSSAPKVTGNAPAATATVAIAASTVTAGASADDAPPSEPSLDGALAYETLAGAAVCGDVPRASKGRLPLGVWLETDGRSRVMLEVADLGRVEIAQSTKLRILPGKSPGEHRLELAHGTIHARINAPPRVFIVETQAATAVDLGCVYTLEVGDDGIGLLRVGRGEVALERSGGSVVVKRGEVAEMRPGHGPGTPFLADASTDLRRSLGAWDFDGGPFAPVLGAATARDAITLVHALERVDEPADRRATIDRIAALVPAAKSVDAKAVVARDKAALEKLEATVVATK